MRLTVIGIGNRFRGDDGAGLWAARKLRLKKLPGVTVVESNGEGTALMETWEGFDAVILVDAMLSGSSLGTVRRFDAGAGPLPADLFSSHSTHSFGIAAAVELARVLNRLPPRLVIYGIEGKSFAHDCGLSPEVETGSMEAVEWIMTEVSSLLSLGNPGIVSP
jgi:hydrogenase maturation protease